MSELKFQTLVYCGGMAFHVMEGYDSIFERLKDATMKADKDGLGMPAPIELTARTEGDVPVRVLLQPQAITAVSEQTSEHHVAVVE
jgi:hypothetical protein